MCGDGIVGDAEACDDGNDVDTDGCTSQCEPAYCGDGYVWEGVEVCDQKYGCSEDCKAITGCYWDLDAAPLPVQIHPSAGFGQIAFDRNCDLIVSGAYSKLLYRLSHVDGSVTPINVVVPGDAVTGLASHPDGRIYFTVNLPDQMWALELDDSVSKIADLPGIALGLTTAPAGFGSYSGNLIWASENRVYATQPASGSSTAVGALNVGHFTSPTFGPDNTLYVGTHTTARVYTLSDLGVFKLFADLPSNLDGLLVNPTGTQLHVASYANGASIDTLGIPGAAKVEGPFFNLNGGSFPTGMVFDAAGRLLVLGESNMKATVDSFVP